LKLTCDETLSNVASNVNLRRYIQGDMPKAYGPQAVQYYKEHWPVGTRDAATRDALLSRAAVSAVWSGDLTWTLAPLCPRNAATNVVIVDVDPAVLKKVVPASVIANATVLTQFAYNAPMTSHELARYAGVFGNLRAYSCTTSLLITQRLHAVGPGGFARHVIGCS
jgi:hypothetical protein